MKYNEQFKFSAVETYLVGPAGFTKVAQQFEISASLLRSWVSRYRLHGIAGLAIRAWSGHSAEFKLSVLKHMWDNGLSYRQTAAVFNLPNASHIGEWERRHKQSGFEGLKRRRNENPRMKAPQIPAARVPVDEKNCSHDELIDEVKRLRAENAYLKKLKALERLTKPAACPGGNKHAHFGKIGLVRHRPSVFAHNFHHLHRLDDLSTSLDTSASTGESNEQMDSLGYCNYG